MIKTALKKLLVYCRKQKYKGWDNFDGLNSFVFKRSTFYKFRLIRLFWIQIFKRSPINLRKILAVPKGYNAKALSLFISGMVKLDLLKETKTLVEQLKHLAYKNKGLVCWGYNFPWQSRAFYAPIGTPNMIATVFAGNAFLDYYEKTRDKEYYDYAENSSQYILDQLKLYENKKILCFSYIPGSNVIVHNVNMLGACFLARIYSYNNNYELFEKSKKAMYFSMKDLSNNFMWKYGKESHHSFIDNFHTGFNLVALKKWMDFTGDTLWRKELKNAYNRWISSFWLENGIPKYYINSVFPIDIHCCAQGIITHYNLSEYNTKSNEWIKKIAYWAIKNMQDKKGYFYYQITRLYKNRIPYIRWSQAWMFYSLALLNSDEKKKNV